MTDQSWSNEIAKLRKEMDEKFAQQSKSIFELNNKFEHMKFRMEKLQSAIENLPPGDAMGVGGACSNSVRSSQQNSISDTSSFTYSENLQRLIGKHLPQFEKVGPSLGLSINDGCCEFFTSDEFEVMNLHKVKSGVKNSAFSSKFIVLPDQLNGLIIRALIVAGSKNNCEMKLLAKAELNETRNVSLPVKFRLKIEMNSKNGSGKVYHSDTLQFNINKYSHQISPENGKLSIPLADTGENTFNGGIKMKFLY